MGEWYRRAVRRVLFVSYAFPPVGGAGVQRSTKFVRYLPEHGWACSVLTAANPSVPVRDERMLEEIPAGTEVVRTRTLEPGYAAKQAVSSGGGGGGGARAAALGLAKRAAMVALQPDAQVLWNVTAAPAGAALLRRTKHDAIVVSGPPFSSFLLGAFLARQARLPLVLDYRDEWDLSNQYWENKRLDPLSLRLQEQLQRACVRSSRALVATSRPSRDALRAVVERAGASCEVACIYNGYDAHDLEHAAASPLAAPPADGRYRVSYVGTLWALTDVAPVVRALELLDRDRPDVAARIELVLAGRRVPAQDALLDRLEATRVRLVRHPYVDHAGAVGLLRSSDALALLLSDVPGAGRVVPGKIFEYMAAERTILCVTPEGEARSLLGGSPHARLLSPGDPAEIARALAAEVTRRGAPVDAAGFDPRRFERRALAGELAALLDRVVPS